MKTIPPRKQLLNAIEKNDIPTVSSLIASGAVNLDDESLPLHEAAIRGRVDIMSLLLDAGADINAVSKHRQTSAAHIAIYSNRLAALKLLVERSANLAVADSYGRTLLREAAMLEIDADAKNQFVILMLDAGAPLDRLEGSFLLRLVTSAAVFERLSARNIDLNAMRDEDGGTLCHHAARNVTHEDDLDFLVFKASRNVNAVDRCGLTPLHWAAASQSASAMRMLVELGAEIDALTINQGWSPLHVLCSALSPSVYCVELLLVLGADVSLVARDSGETPCHFAARNFTLSACLAAGGDLDQPNNIGETTRTIAFRKLYVLPTADEIAAARQRIAKTRLDLVRHRALQICLGLQPLNLNALELCEIMMHSFGALGSLIAFHQWWAIATKVKHFRNNKQQQ